MTLHIPRLAIGAGIYAELAGTIDLHVHGHPDICDRLLPDAGLVTLAKACGMRAVMLVSHAWPTHDRAALAQAAAGGGIEVLGLICLNPSVGDFNPDAVRLAIHGGCRAVWMPSLWTEHHVAHLRGAGTGSFYAGAVSDYAALDLPAHGLTVLDGVGHLMPDVLRVLDQVAAADVMLATGRLSLDEAHLLIDAARERGITRLLVHAVNDPVLGYPLPDLLDMVGRGAALEFAFSALPDGRHHEAGGQHAPSAAACAEIMRAAGPGNCVVTSGGGQVEAPMPIEAMRLWIAHLRALRFTPAEIDQMTVHVPARLLRLAD